MLSKITRSRDTPTGQQKLLQVHSSRGVKPGKKKHGEKSIKTAKSGRRKNRRQRDIIRVSEPKCGNKKRRKKMKERELKLELNVFDNAEV